MKTVRRMAFIQAGRGATRGGGETLAGSLASNFPVVAKWSAFLGSRNDKRCGCGSRQVRSGPRDSKDSCVGEKSPGQAASCKTVPFSSLSASATTLYSAPFATAQWCNGSTTDSDSVCLGSSPSWAATLKGLPNTLLGAFFVGKFEEYPGRRCPREARSERLMGDFPCAFASPHRGPSGSHERAHQRDGSFHLIHR